MKKLFLPAVFALSLASAAFTRPSLNAKKDYETGYYYNEWNICTPYVIDDDNCIADDLGYICMENTPDEGWQVMLQYGFETVCYQPYYSYFSNE